jgi:hypothetical protein
MSEVRAEADIRRGRHLGREASRVWNTCGDLVVKIEARISLNMP